MSNVHRILGISLLLACLSLRAADDDLQANLTRGVELQNQMAQILGSGDKSDKSKLAKVVADLAALKAPLCKEIKPYLPKPDSEYGTYFGPCNYSDGAFRYELKDEHKRHLATIQIYYHPDGVEPKSRGMYAKCLDYPASRVMNRRVWVLINKVELHVESRDDSFNKDSVLDAIIKSFDLEGLAAL